MDDNIIIPKGFYVYEDTKVSIVFDSGWWLDITLYECDFIVPTTKVYTSMNGLFIIARVVVEE